MRQNAWSTLALFLLLILFPSSVSKVMCAERDDCRAVAARERVEPVLNAFLRHCDARVGSHVFLRVIKEDSIMELWVKPNRAKRYVLAKKYPIAAWSGTLGTKEKEGDGQTPEGFYEVRPAGLNPLSSYHLSFNIGYPNAADLALGRTGSLIMVHGGNVSIGCLAMTDPGIEEIYTMVAQALAGGQKSVPVQIYPFVPVPARLEKEKDSPHAEAWNLLAAAWAWTERHHAPVQIIDGKPVVDKS